VLLNSHISILDNANILIESTNGRLVNMGTIIQASDDKINIEAGGKFEYNSGQILKK